ncbi:GNAT family N-acetyltransferase [Pleurocapsa sp. PCC 7319]|uniref:GNAT family N-acetyltransferase n=1 Tax=Pleurocapsa sp. PCC 7319 TaxID=118161 RepID=UPI000344DDCF|nr:GNAT family N-acetyltransferase [Pleurocapsa sp. PCC 7319]
MIEVRHCKLQDLAALREIYLLARRDTFSWLDTSGYKLLDFDKHTEGESIFVASDQNILVGFASVWLQKNFIHLLYVHPRRLREGIGHQLLTTCLDVMDRPAKLKCLTRNQNAVDFYLAIGWQITETAVGEDGEYFLMSLEKNLTKRCK